MIASTAERRRVTEFTPPQAELPLRSAAYLRVLDQVRRFARERNAPILIEGESGTGKTRIARLLHTQSARAAGPYEYVILSVLDDALANSELFGHVTGAFTDARSNRAGHFASAHGGTLFLDEIGKASPAVQRKLLHAIEYGEIRPLGADRDMRVDVRVVAATNVRLEERVASGEFLPDLFARLGTFRIRLPSLRDRRADIPVLVEYYVAQHARSCGYDGHTPDVDPELMDALTTAEWPYNLRQLDSTVNRLLVEAEGAATITLEHCRDDLEYLRMGIRRFGTPTLDDIETAIALAGNNVSRAARALGVDRTTLHRKRNLLRQSESNGEAPSRRPTQ
jgi:two-component system NtrC family response regulator